MTGRPGRFYFVTAIDTGAGKTVATGLMGRWLVNKGVEAITAKLAQTGCAGISEDILLHRRIMGQEPGEEDVQGLTCPYVLGFPASPHLAARLEGKAILEERLVSAFDRLSWRHEAIIVEGAGGWLVPLSEELLAADFVAARGWPVILVTSPKLGSINHTLLTLEAILSRGLTVSGVLYNLNHQENPAIVEDTRGVVRAALARAGTDAKVVDLPPSIDPDEPPDIDFSGIFGV